MRRAPLRAPNARAGKVYNGMLAGCGKTADGDHSVLESASVAITSGRGHSKDATSS